MEKEQHELRPLEGAGDAKVPSSHTHQDQPRSIDDFLESVYSNNSTASDRCGGVLYDIFRDWRYYIIFLALGTANSGDSTEMSCIKYILSSYQFQQDILRVDAVDDESGEGEIDFAGKGAAVASTHFAGMLISCFLSGVLADVWGRRPTLQLGVVVNAVVGLFSAGARNSSQFCLMRFICGIGLGMVAVNIVTLTAEISPPSKRGRFITLVMSCFILGSLYTGLAALVIFRASGSGNWRLFMLINALPTIMAAILVSKFVPESPRFYLSQGNLEKAVQSANSIASRLSCAGRLLTVDELAENSLKSKMVGESSHTVSAVGSIERLLRDIWLRLTSIKQVFRDGMHRITVPLQLTFVFLTIVSGVEMWWTRVFQSLDLSTDPYALSFFHSMAGIPGVMLASGLIDKLGRRRMLLIGLCGGSANLLLIAWLVNTIQHMETDAGEHGYPLIILALTCVQTICLYLAWLALDCLSAEAFPTKIRSTGRSACVATGRVAGIFAQYLYGPLISQNQLSCMLGLGSLFAICGAVAAFLTTDTTHIDLQDHWDCSPENPGTDDEENGVKDTPCEMKLFAKTTHAKYLSMETKTVEIDSS
ncbi:hypothetical protein ACHAWF_015744 [Thalassiosira exigua]